MEQVEDSTASAEKSPMQPTFDEPLNTMAQLYDRARCMARSLFATIHHRAFGGLPDLRADQVTFEQALCAPAGTAVVLNERQADLLEAALTQNAAEWKARSTDGAHRSAR